MTDEKFGSLVFLIIALAYVGLIAYGLTLYADPDRANIELCERR